MGKGARVLDSRTLGVKLFYMEEGPLAWQADAICKGVDLAYFFRDQVPKNGEKLNLTAFKEICKGCPVKSFCLEFALLYDCKGVWGGKTEKERNQKYYRDLREILIEDAIESGVYISQLAV